jgi:Asp/Glu/hydantoin racemase
MIEAAQKMEKDGIQAITTSCGFNALFQTELANSVNVPVFTSSLLQVPLVYRLLKKEQSVGIITAYENFLTRDHLSAVGIGSSIPIRIVGLEKTTVFSGILTGSTTPFSIREFQEQLMEIVKKFLKQEQNLGAIVLECTDLPPFTADIRKMSGLPIFDIVTLTNFIHYSSIYSSVI